MMNVGNPGNSDSSLSIMKGKRNLLFTVLVFLLILLFCLDILLGSVRLGLHDVFRALLSGSEEYINTIVLKFRLPKAITAILAGIALSVSGLQMQTLFRNPMAGPYVLGISSGASLGVAFVILGFPAQFLAGSINALGSWAMVASACIGAGAVMIIMMAISLRVRNILTVLVLGIMLSSGISAIVSIMQYFSDESMLKAYVIWTMGSLGNLTSQQLSIMLVSLLAGVLLSLISIKMLNALLLGENYAGSIGLNIRFARIIIFTGTSILAGVVTAFCGPIGFIGIAVPHISRIIFRTSDHRILLPSVIILGAVIMLASDILSQLPGYDKVLPVNSVTSLVGIPVVIWVILRNRKYSGEF